MTGAIVCGIDDSDSAKGAARVARALSSKLGLRVIFVRAIEPRARDADVTAIAERLERLSASVNGADFGAGWAVEVGHHPADALVEAAKKLEATMIVVGSTGPRSSLLGSVSADISRRAPCPVVVVPPGADAGVEDRANGRGPTRSRSMADGAARFARAVDGTDFAGGIARFGLGSADREPS